MANKTISRSGIKFRRVSYLRSTFLSLHFQQFLIIPFSCNSKFYIGLFVIFKRHSRSEWNDPRDPLARCLLIARGFKRKRDLFADYASCHRGKRYYRPLMSSLHADEATVTMHALLFIHYTVCCHIMVSPHCMPWSVMLKRGYIFVRPPRRRTHPACYFILLFRRRIREYENAAQTRANLFLPGAIYRAIFR